MYAYEIDYDDLTEQISKLEGFDAAASRRMRPAAKASQLYVEGQWKIIAPFDVGAYAGSIAGKVERVSGLDVETVVGTNITKGGVSYPRVLELGSGYHYRSGPRKGQPLAGQVKLMAEKAMETVRGIFKKAADGLMRDLAVK